MTSPIFTTDERGRVIELTSFFSLFPGRENGMKMLFGGEVVKVVDELSGNLATLFIGKKGLQAVHVGEEVIFHRPIKTDEACMIVARIARVTEKIVCVHIRMYGGSPQEPNAFTRRYEGFGLCVVLDTDGKMVRDLEPFFDNSSICREALRIIEFQHRLRTVLLAIPD